MNSTLSRVIKMQREFSQYNMICTEYNLLLAKIRRSILGIDLCQSSEEMMDLCSEISQDKEKCHPLIDDIEKSSAELIKNMKSLTELLDDY